MKKSITLISFAFLLNCFCFTDLSAFMMSKKIDIQQNQPPQYIAKKTTLLEQFIAKNAIKKHFKIGKSINLNKKTKLSLILACVSMAWLLLLRLAPYIGLKLAFILSLIALIVGTFGTLMVADDVLRDKTATDKQRSTAKSSKIIVLVNLITLALLLTLAFIASKEG
jgi:hypothetical protein